MAKRHDKKRQLLKKQRQLRDRRREAKALRSPSSPAPHVEPLEPRLLLSGVTYVDQIADLSEVVDNGGQVGVIEVGDEVEWNNSVNGIFGTDVFGSIQSAVDATDPEGTVNVADGVFTENVVIDQNLSLLSSNGRSATTIQGISSGSALGTVQVTNNTTDVQIGGTGQGFTIVGINGNGAIENAGVYFQGSHADAQILDNEIVADGDSGLTTEYGATISGFVIDGNAFSGQTFTGSNPGGIGFSTQFNVGNNVPRQLVVMGGGTGGGNTSNITFTNNVLSGIAGGISADDGVSEQGNTLVTIDSDGATITGNTFAGETTRFGSALRARGSNVDIASNVFDATDMGASTNLLFLANPATANGLSDPAGFGGVIDNNTFTPNQVVALGETLFAAPAGIQAVIDVVSPAAELRFGGDFAGNVDVDQAVTLGGNFSLTGSLSVTATGATLDSGFSPGVITSGNLSLAASSTLVAEVNGTTPGTQHDQYVVNGTVDLGGATLDAFGSITAGVADSVVLIDNDGTDAVTGQFAGLANASTLTINGESFAIFYDGGDGNDVTLVRVPATVDTVYVDEDWAGTTAGDDPDTGDAIPMVFGYNAFASIQAGVDAVAAAGDVIVYETSTGDGDYDENVVINDSLDLLAAAGEAPVLDAGFGTGLDINGTSTVSITGLEVIGGIFGVNIEDATVTIDQSVVRDATATAVTVDDGGDLTLTASEVLDASTGVQVIDGSADIAGSILTGHGTGLLVSLNGTATVTGSSLAGNTNFAIQNAASAVVDASGNWWGTTDETLVQAERQGNVDFTPFLASGTDTDGGAVGFGADFASLFVTTLGTQAGTDGRIQEGVDDVDNTTLGTVNVLAGDYYGTVDIAKNNIDLLGANAGVDPNTSVRGSESILYSDDWYSLYVDQGNVTIDGLLIDGDNPLLTSGNVLNGADVDVDYGIYASNTDAQGSIEVRNNIVQNITTMGFVGYTGGSYANGDVSSNNVIANNKIDNIATGRGVVPLWNYYADVTDNVITRTAVGLYSENAHKAEFDGSSTWSGNDISASRAGIWYNLAYGAATPLTITNNTVTAEDDAAGTRFSGVWLTSLGGSADPTISANDITIGSAITQQGVGYDLWNNGTTATGGITITGGTVDGGDYGVWVNNFEGYPTTSGSNGGSTQVTVDNIDLDSFDIAGVFVSDSDNNTNNATVTANLVNNTSLAGSAGSTGVLTAGADATTNVDSSIIVSGTDIAYDVDEGTLELTGTTVTGAGTGIRVDNFGSATMSGGSITGFTTGIDVLMGAEIELSNVDFDAGTDNATDLRVAVDAGDVTLSGGNNFAGDTYFIENLSALDIDATAAAFDEAGNFAIEDKVFHGPDDPASGIVRVVAGEVFVTTPGTGVSDETIQNAIDAADAGDTVNVQAGTYVENVVVDKYLTLLGAGDSASGTVLDGSNGDNAVRITASGLGASDRLTLEDLRVVDSQLSGIRASNVDHIALTGVTAANNGNDGIQLTNNFDVRFTDVTAVGNGTSMPATVGRGIGFNGVEDLILANTTTADNWSAGVSITSRDTTRATSNVTIDGGSFTNTLLPAALRPDGSVGIAFFLGAGDNGSIQDVVITGDVDATGHTQAGISLFNADPVGVMQNFDIGQNVGDNVDLASNTVGLQVFGPADDVTVDADFDLGTTPLANGAGLGLFGFDDAGTASPTNVTLAGSAFTGYDNANPAITLVAENPTSSTPPYYASVTGLDATGATFDGVDPNAAAVADFFVIEDQVHHAIDVAGVGLVEIDPAGNHYVTTDSFLAGINTEADLQRGVDVATAGDTLFVEAGTYNGTVNLDRAITVSGPNVGLHPDRDVRNAEAILNGNFVLQSDNVTIEGMAITGAQHAVEGVSAGSTHSNIVLRELEIYGQTGAGATVQPILLGFGAGGGIGSTNWTIERSRIRDIQADDATGIVLFNVDGVVIDDNVIEHTNASFDGRRGMNLDGVVNADVTNNIVEMGATSTDGLTRFNAARYQLQISNSDRDASTILIEDNDFSGAYDGIVTLGNGVAADVTIRGNLIEDNFIGIRPLAGTNSPGGGVDNLLIIDNDITDHLFAGVFVSVGTGLSADVTLDNNTLESDSLGIRAAGNADVKLENNDLTGNEVGVQVRDGALVDLGGGTLGSVGNNDLSGYTGVGGNYAVENENLAAQPDVFAENNNWGPISALSAIEQVVFDDTDDATRSMVIFTNPQNLQPAPNTVYVNEDFVGNAFGDDPDGGASPASQFGVDAFTNIQDGVDAVANGGTVVVFGGDYDQAVTIDKALTLDGRVDPFDIADTVVTLTHATGGILTVDADNVAIDDITIQGQADTDGLVIDTTIVSLSLTRVDIVGNASQGRAGILVTDTGDVTDLDLVDVTLGSNAIGMRVADAGVVDGMTADADTHFDNNILGLLVEADPTLAGGAFKDATFTGTTFDGANQQRGVYLEKLDNAVFDGIDVVSNGDLSAFEVRASFGSYSGLQLSGTVTSTAASAEPAVNLRARPDTGAADGSLTNVTLEDLTVAGGAYSLRLFDDVTTNLVLGPNVALLNANQANVLLDVTPASPAIDLGAIALTNSIGDFIHVGAETDVDATGVSFDNGSALSLSSLDDLFTIEDGILHAIDAETFAGMPVGLVTVVAGELFVTTDSFFTPAGTTQADIQRAINQAAAGDTVNVDDGTYVGAVTIDKDLTLLGQGPATVIESPGSVGGAFTYSGSAKEAVVAITDGVVTIEDLTVDGAGLGNSVVSGNDYVGVGVYNANATLDGLTVTGVTDTPFSGVQRGRAIFVGADDGGTYAVTVNGSTIDDYQKNAIDVRVTGTGTTLDATITDNDITGAGATPTIAQNGVVLLGGVSGLIADNQITGHEFTGTGAAAAGILLFNNGTATVTVNANDVSDGDIGVVLSASDATVEDNTITGNGDAGVYLSDGHATLEDNTITSNGDGVRAWGGDVTVGALNQITGNTFDGVDVRNGGTAIVSNATITGNGGAGVEVEDGEALVESTDLTGNAIGVLVENGGVADLGQLGAGTNFTGLGVSAGGNDLSSYTAPATTSGGAIVNLNADAPNGNAGPQGLPDDVTAFNNTFFSGASADIETVVYHDADDNAVGFVDYAGLANFTVSLDTTTIDENGTVTLSGSFTNDPQEHTLTIDWDDGTVDNIAVPQGTFDLSTLNITHTYLDDNPSGDASNTYNVTATISEDANPTASLTDTSLAVTVDNVAPTIDSVTYSATTINEDGSVTVSGAINDVGSNDTIDLVIDWGDGSPATTLTGLTPGDSFSQTYTYEDDGVSPGDGTASNNYTITLTATDDDTGSATTSQVITVNNVAPQSLAITPDSTNVYNEGELLSFTASATDNADDVMTYTWEITGPGLSSPITGSGTAISFTPVDNGGYTIDLTVEDDDLGVSTLTYNVPVVSNVDPTIDSVTYSATTINEDGSVTVSGTINDVGSNDTIDLVIDWGDGSPDTTLTGLTPGSSFSQTHTYEDDNPTNTASDDYTIMLTATDDDTASATTSEVITVNNVAPVAAILGAPTTSPEGTAINLTADVTDPGTLDTFTYAWEVLKDGNPFTTGSGANFTFTPDDAAAAGTTYTVNLTVTDDDTGVGTDSATINVTNVAPVVPLAAQGSSSINEGDTFVLEVGPVVDPGDDTITAFQINWGDGDSDFVTGNDLTSLSTFSHVYTDGLATPDRTITIDVIDEDGSYTPAGSLTIQVNNVAPTAAFNAFSPVDEGSTTSVFFAAQSDPGTADAATGYRYAYDFDDDGTFDQGDGTFGGSSTSSSFTVPAPFLDDGPDTVTVRGRIIDKDGGFTDVTQTIDIDNVLPTFNAGADATVDVNTAFNRTITFNDPGSEDLAPAGWIVTVDYGDGSGPQAPATFNPLTKTFTLGNTYTATGNYTVTVTVDDQDGTVVTDTFDVEVVPTSFQVDNFTVTDSGFDATFNRAADLAPINLYDGDDAAVETADITVLLNGTDEVNGSLVWDASTDTLSWVKTGGALEAGTYTVTIRSGNDALQDLAGDDLDGNGDGTAGDDFTSTFVVSAGRTVYLPDFARGPGQDVDVDPTDTASDLPLTISDAAGVTSVDVDIEYDPSLLDITSATLASGLPGGWTVTSNTATPGLIKLTISGPTALSGTDVALAKLTAEVPSGAAYGTSQALELVNLEINEGALTGKADTAIHKNAFIGDTDGNGVYSAFDASNISRVVVDLDNGFDAHDWTDPVIVGDATGNGALSGQDASLVQSEAALFATPEIPPSTPPAFVPMGGIDPLLSIDDNILAGPGGTVVVPVSISAPGADGVRAVTFDVFYDSSKLSITDSDVTLSSLWTASEGWSLVANTNVPSNPDQIRITLSNSVATDTGPGDIVELAFTVTGSVSDGEVIPLDVQHFLPSGEEGGFIFTDDDGSLLIDAAAPTVEGVYVADTGWSPSFLSHLDTFGLGDTDFGYEVPTTGDQLETLPWVGLDQVSVTFSEEVNIGINDLDLFGVNVAQYTVTGFAADPATSTYTWTLDTAIAADKLALRVVDSVTDLAGNALDGEYVTNSGLGSGDGTEGGEFEFRFDVLPGDVNASGSVFGSDVTLIRNNQFQFAGSPTFDPRLDVNGSGSIFGSDATLVRGLQFTFLPSGSPVVTPATSAFSSVVDASTAGSAESLDLRGLSVHDLLGDDDDEDDFFAFFADES